MSSSIVSSSTTSNTSAVANLTTSAAQFREIHKNTWLKRLTAEGKKITVGPKKSERSWVVFCVHDDTEALLEGYAEPRQAPSHSPEWIVSMQDTLHISHALIPNSHEFEFVVTLSNEVVRFHAMSWEIMQEWVETLRSKLREMKILSPRENLYTKLPEVRAPLLPTRDPTSPLPAPPPVPAALVPGVERVIPHSTLQETPSTTNATDPSELANTRDSSSATSSSINSSDINADNNANSNSNGTSIATNNVTNVIHGPMLTSMSNTLTQNLLNMLSDPISAYSEHLNDTNAVDDIATIEDTDEDFSDDSKLDICEFNNEFLTPLLRKSNANISKPTLTGSSVSADNGIRVDIIGANHRVSADQIKNFESLLQCERLIPRPQTSRSLSAGAADKSKKQNTKIGGLLPNESHSNSTSNNITELEISTDSIESEPIITEITTTTTTTSSTSSTLTAIATTTAKVDPKTNITIIQVSTDTNTENDENPPNLPVKSTIADIFKFPETNATLITPNPSTKHHEYKSNVQIIPSILNSSTIQVLGDSNVSTIANQYSTPVKKHIQNVTAAVTTTSSSALSNVSTMENQKITTVHVIGGDTTTATTTTALSVYGTCYAPPSGHSTAIASQSTPKLPKKIILSANTSGVTNITVGTNSACDRPSEMIRKNVEESKNAGSDNSVRHNLGNVHYEKVFLSSSIPIATQVSAVSSSSVNTVTVTPMSPKLNAQWNSPRRQAPPLPTEGQTANSSRPQSPTPMLTQHELKKSKATTVISTASQMSINNRNKFSPIPVASQIFPTRPPLLTRGLTEAVITTRPSRKDFHQLRSTPVKKKSQLGGIEKTTAGLPSNNNDENPSTSNMGNHPVHVAVNRTNSETKEQRRRSSSTSDAQVHRGSRTTNNNEFSNSRPCESRESAMRIQQPPQPFRSVENGLAINSSNQSSPPPNIPAKRMTLREQQVMQLRREIMHPGGVRLQLRRKDCVGSIAWVDAFGAVWVAGWKQKEHPVLYNALHIGDQLLSIAGVTINTAAETNKIIRNTNTLFVEVLVRRIPFGRGYAIRREREGQCLGLIRDGNTSTIVDVVPNSLAARHGLPPKAQSCDGQTLTFWILTEINGRPLNLFFKDNEIRDRLNSVGRDISILVQPSDLIAKLKKQLKSLRGYKDYLVQ